MNGLRELHELLMSLFDASELRRFVNHEYGSYVASSLPGSGVSLSQFSFDLVDVLRRRGLLDASFFAKLRKERSYRAADIDRVAKLVLGDAEPAAEPPRAEQAEAKRPGEAKRPKQASEADGFDVFLCYNSEDSVAVRRIYEQLVARGLRPWLDVEEVPPGVSWQLALEAQIETIKSAAVCVGAKGLGPWQADELYAFLREFKKRRVPVIPVLLPDCPETPKLPPFLSANRWVDFRVQKPDPIKQLVWGITGKRVRD